MWDRHPGGAGHYGNRHLKGVPDPPAETRVKKNHVNSKDAPGEGETHSTKQWRVSPTKQGIKNGPELKKRKRRKTGQVGRNRRKNR